MVWDVVRVPRRREAAITGGITAIFVNGRGQPHGVSLSRTGGETTPRVDTIAKSLSVLH